MVSRSVGNFMLSSSLTLNLVSSTRLSRLSENCLQKPSLPAVNMQPLWRAMQVTPLGPWSPRRDWIGDENYKKKKKEWGNTVSQRHAKSKQATRQEYLLLWPGLGWCWYDSGYVGVYGASSIPNNKDVMGNITVSVNSSHGSFLCDGAFQHWAREQNNVVGWQSPKPLHIFCIVFCGQNTKFCFDRHEKEKEWKHKRKLKWTTCIPSSTHNYIYTLPAFD